MQIDLIVTRHAGAVAWLASDLGYSVAVNSLVRPCGGRCSQCGGGDSLHCEMERSIPVLFSVTADDVRGKHVVGNLPLHLAALCQSVTAIEFAGDAPRGQEYSAADMTAAGAKLTHYWVMPATREAWETVGTTGGFLEWGRDGGYLREED